MKPQVIVIGAGIGGLTTSIRLAKAGFKVIVLEQSDVPGGKLKQMQLGPYRFDRGPSLLTLPELITELGAMAGIQKSWTYTKLDSVQYVHFEDGTFFSSGSSPEQLADVLSGQNLAAKPQVLRFFKRATRYYQTTASVFLKQSLHKPRSYFNKTTLRALMRFPLTAVLSKMAGRNQTLFKNEKVQQFFNRYATYNGSHPYCAPALLNMIPHLEFCTGAFFPNRGMVSIPQYLHEAARHLGVEFYFNSRVTQINQWNQSTWRVCTSTRDFEAPVIVNNTDVHFFYTRLAPQLKYPRRFKAAEKSSSAYVFFWGINRQFKNLQVHNVFFSKHYKQEFDAIFKQHEAPQDPTVYVHISSKICTQDAPYGHENWFVMVNVPHNANQAPVGYGKELRQRVINKLNRMLGVYLENHIVCEAHQDPFTIETETSSFGGSLYGNASNSKWSAFLRHPNFKSSAKGLYFVGGSVHPGGGIPLCIYSGHITADLIEKEYAL